MRDVRGWVSVEEIYDRVCEDSVSTEDLLEVADWFTLFDKSWVSGLCQILNLKSLGHLCIYTEWMKIEQRKIDDGLMDDWMEGWWFNGWLDGRMMV